MSNLYSDFYNDMPTERMRTVLDRNKAEEIATYIERNEQNYKDNGRSGITLKNICVRFRLRQEDTLRIIESNPDVLILTNFALQPPPKGSQNWGDMLSACFLPKYWPEAPAGRKFVTTTRSLGD